MLRGDRFRALRESKNLTHEELAERLSLGTTQIWRYETGKTDPAGDIVGRIASLFDVSTDYLLGLTDDPTPNLKIDNLTSQEKAILSALRRGLPMEAIKAIVSDE